MDSLSSALNSTPTAFASPKSGSTSSITASSSVSSTTPSASSGPSSGPSGFGPSSSGPSSFGASALESASRPATPVDPGYITVEPDGRDDVTFRDRLRQAIEGFFNTFTENASAQTDRALASIEESLSAAEASGQDVLVQFRVTSVNVTLAGEAGSRSGGRDDFASIRTLGLEIGVARDGQVSASDTRVLGLDGRSLGLAERDIRAGLGGDGFSQRQSGNTSSSSDAAAERLETARASLERVKVVQDALKSFRSGDLEPLRRVLEGDSSSSLAGLLPRSGGFSVEA
jgi:hypothetical protein